MPHLCAGSLQRLHGAEADVSDLHWSHLLPTSEAHGGRQDPLQGQRARPDPQQTAHGGAVPVRHTGVCLSGVSSHPSVCLLTCLSSPVTVVFVLERWSVTVRSLTEQLSSSENVCLRPRTRIRCTSATCVDSWPSPTHAHTPTSVGAAATRHRYVQHTALVHHRPPSITDPSVCFRSHWCGCPMPVSFYSRS